MKITVIGAGAMGCRFGTAFADAGAEVWLYDVWADHMNRIASNGLHVHDGFGTERYVKMNATSDIATIPSPDVLVVFTKTIYSEDALKTAKPILGADTVLITLQNGLGNIETMQKICPGQPIIAGVTNYAGDMIGPGEVELKGSGITKMMAIDPDAASAAQIVVALLKQAGHHAELSEDVLKDIWEKVAFNAGMNTVSAVTGLTVAGMGSTEQCRKLLFDIASEAVAVANAEGVPAEEQHVHDVILSVFDPKMSGDHKSSMLQDRIAKRQTEIDAICGEVIRRGQLHSIPTPKAESMYALVNAIQKNYDHIVLN
ncbi:MAG: ketopantoate reductase family protein [Anaerofustis sp.]